MKSRCLRSRAIASRWIIPSSAGILTASTFFIAPVGAQLTPDASLGAESSVVNPGNVQGLPVDLIEGGAARGTNLFHSFGEFNVHTGQSVYFANPIGIENILTRVTGGNASTIDGLLGVNGGANLFLLNPQGIFWGPNARLDISGSLTASTGDRWRFADGSEFSAVPQANELLTVSVPLGVQFNDRAQGDIHNQGELAVGDGSSLTLFGETVLHSGSLMAPGGTVQVLGDRVGLTDQARVNVAGATDGGTVQIGGNYLSQGPLPNATRTFVGAEAVIDADAGELGDGGRVIVWADEATQFAGQISARGGLLEGDGGFVEVSGRESLAFTGTVDTTAVNGQAGQLLLDPANIVISTAPPAGFVTVGQGDGVLADFLFGEAENAGQNSHLTPATVVALLDMNDLTLEATNKITISNDIPSPVKDNDLTLRASNIEVNARIEQNEGGDIVVETPQTAGSSVVVNGSSNGSGIISRFTFGSRGGNVRITTYDLTVLSENSASPAVIEASTEAAGDAGSAHINARGTITVSGSSSLIVSDVATTTANPQISSGGVFIETDNLLIRNGATVGARTFGQGSAGPVRVNATGSITVEGSGSSLASNVDDKGNGNSGGVVITTNHLFVREGGRVSATTFDQGNAGFVEINAENIEVNGRGSFLSSQVDKGAVGNSDGIAITTRDLFVLNGATLSASTLGQGNAGRVTINADSIEVNGDNSFIASQVTENAVGDSGGIVINTRDLAVLNGASLGASTFGQGNAGRVAISADTIEVNGGSSFIDSQVTETAEGDSGGIVINTRDLAVLNGASLSAEVFGRGTAGQVLINASGEVIIRGIGEESSPDGLPDRSVISSAVNLNNAGNNQTVESNGNGLIIEAGVLSVLDGAEVSVATARTVGRVGDLDIAAGSVFLDDGRLLASSAANTGGGNIILDVNEVIVMRRGSFINAEATNPQAGDGGNIVIDTDFLIAASNENNDIIANAVGGNGGRVQINAISQFNLTEQRNLPTAVLRALSTNDLSASSQNGVEGEIVLNTLDVDPSQGLNELPADLVDRANQIARGCGLGNQGPQNEFVVTGRGGLRPGASDLTPAGDGGMPLVTYEDGFSQSMAIPQPAAAEQPLMEAQGIGFDADGNPYLVARSPEAVAPTAQASGSHVPDLCGTAADSDRY